MIYTYIRKNVITVSTDKNIRIFTSAQCQCCQIYGVMMVDISPVANKLDQFGTLHLLELSGQHHRGLASEPTHQTQMW